MDLWIPTPSRGTASIGEICACSLPFDPREIVVCLFSIYSNQGPNHPGSYEYTLRTADNDTYSFVGLDMCPRPGAGRPFNFLGHISEVGNSTLLESSSIDVLRYCSPR